MILLYCTVILFVPKIISEHILPENYRKNRVNNEISKSVTKNNKSMQNSSKNTSTKVENKNSKYL